MRMDMYASEGGNKNTTSKDQTIQGQTFDVVIRDFLKERCEILISFIYMA